MVTLPAKLFSARDRVFVIDAENVGKTVSR